jgi:hypothetical protein
LKRIQKGLRRSGVRRKKRSGSKKRIIEKPFLKRPGRRYRKNGAYDRTPFAPASLRKKLKRSVKRRKRRKKKEKSLSKSNTEQARAERAYGWYSKLGLPSRENFKKKIKLIASIDITADDVDLLPWNGSGTMVNVAKLNTMYYNK